MEKRIYVRGQVSEVVSTGIFLTLSGGPQDAYTYYCRGSVFASTQMGSIALMGGHLASREWGMTFRYMALVAAFVCSVYMAEHIRRRHKYSRQSYWRQMVVAIEIILLFLVGFMLQSMNMAANITVSFVCAMQINAFRKVKGGFYATTMCTRNLRDGAEHFYTYHHTKGPGSRDQCIRHYRVIVIFLVGVASGTVLTTRLVEKTIWVSCSLLLISSFIIFLQKDIRECERTQ